MADVSVHPVGGVERVVRVRCAEVPMSREWCPVQAAICLAYRAWQPYWEPLRALPLPQPDQVQGSLCVGLLEDRLVRVLDDAGGIEGIVLQVRRMLEGLEAAEREIVGMLAAYQDSEGQFDFMAAAKAWAIATRGICPDYCPPGNAPAHAFYTAWHRAKSEKADRYRLAWKKIMPKLTLDYHPESR